MPNSLPRYSSYRNHFFLRLVVVATKEGHASGMPYLNNLAYFSRVDLFYILKMSTVQTGNALVGESTDQKRLIDATIKITI